MNTLCYSQDGHYVATGGDDAKVSFYTLQLTVQNTLQNSLYIERLKRTKGLGLFLYRGFALSFNAGQKTASFLDAITKTSCDASPLKADYARAVQREALLNIIWQDNIEQGGHMQLPRGTA